MSVRLLDILNPYQRGSVAVGESRKKMNDNDIGIEVWSTILGEEYGPGVRFALQMISMVPVEKLSEAINDINRAESIGPIVDPSAWIGGKRFRNAEEYKRVLSVLVGLRKVLPDGKTLINSRPE